MTYMMDWYFTSLGMMSMEAAIPTIIILHHLALT